MLPSRLADASRPPSDENRSAVTDEPCPVNSAGVPSRLFGRSRIGPSAVPAASLPSAAAASERIARSPRILRGASSGRARFQTKFPPVRVDPATLPSGRNTSE